MKLKKIIAVLLMLCLFTACLNVAFAEDSESESSSESDWWNILLMGTDSRSEKLYTLSDSMMILSLNMDSGEIKLTSIMRDTWVVDPVTNKHQKLTELCSLGQGPDRTITAINRDFGMNIEDYVLTNMRGLATIIDVVGGVDVPVNKTERNRINSLLTDYSELSGTERLEEYGDSVHLNGNQAISYARIRKMDSDYVRVQRQQNVLLDMAKSLKSKLNAKTILKVIGSLMTYVDTNLSIPEIAKIAQFALNADIGNVQQYRIPVDGTYKDGMFGNTWCIKPDFEENAQLLHEFIYG